MKTTLYEVLEVSENASKEIIEKAYKVLAKKYHPDLQIPENKQMAEQKMKQINEAYDILSDDFKRKGYDEQLKSQRELERKFNHTVYHSETTHTKNGVNSQRRPPEQAQNQYTSYQGQGMSKEEQRYRQMQRKRYEEELLRRQRQMEQNMQEQYENAYYNYLRNLGYRIKEKWTWEKTKKLIIIIFIMIGILLILWVIPPTHKMMLNIYEGNRIVKVVVDIILGIIKAFFKAIESGFESLFNGW